MKKDGLDQFLTSGHCGYNHSPSWYHESYGTLGTDYASLYNTYHQHNAKIVEMPSSQDSSLIYGVSSGYSDWRNPAVGEPICGSFGMADEFKCGSVTNAWLSWTDDKSGWTMYGADHSMLTIDGDSGSPLIRDTRALGLNATKHGRFARMGDVMADLGATF